MDQWYHCTWSTIHYIAMGYPQSPTPEDKANYKAFFFALGPVLPCKKCSVNYQRHLIELPIEPYLANNDTLFEWTVKIHNIVNRENNKPEWSTEQAKNHYMKTKTNKNQNLNLVIAFTVFIIAIGVSMWLIKRKRI